MSSSPTSKKTIGFIISRKENEKRRAILPKDIKSITNTRNMFFEKGYGSVLSIPDEEYEMLGCNIVTREEALMKDIICDPKVGDAEYLNELSEGQTIFGWVHAVQNRRITDALINNKISAYAWEDMYDCGRHCFWRNNEIAGEAAIMHAFQCYGLMPYNTKVALLGRGNVARGALKILTLLGAEVVVFDRVTEKLFQRELPQYDVLVNAILWDTSRKDHIIYQSDLKRLKPGAMIIDISCDRNGGVQTSVPTTIDDPVYYVDGILHYAVDHTPALFYKTATISISTEISKCIDTLIENRTSEVLKRALVIDCGNILDERIRIFQNRAVEYTSMATF